MSEVARVFVYCDNHKSRAPVADFVRSEDGNWREDRRESSMRLAEGTESGLGIVLVGPGNPRADEIRRHREIAKEYRLFDLRCRDRTRAGKCSRSAAVRSDKLFAYLHRVAAEGVSAVSLSDIAASI